MASKPSPSLNCHNVNAGFKDLLEAEKDSGHRGGVVAGARNPMERLATDRASETDSQGA